MRRLALLHGIGLCVLMAGAACASNPTRSDRPQDEIGTHNELSLVPSDRDAVVGAEVPTAQAASVAGLDPSLDSSEETVAVAIPAVDAAWREAALDVEATEATTPKLDVQESEPIGGAQAAVENLSGWHGLPTTFEGEPLHPAAEHDGGIAIAADGEEEATFDIHGPTPILVPSAGETLVRVESSIANAEVWNDGILLGPTNEYLTLSPGQHDLEIRAVGFLAEHRAVSLSPQDKETIKVELTPAQTH